MTPSETPQPQRKTCFDCLNSTKYSGSQATHEDPGELAYTECQVSPFWELQEEQGDDAAEQCPGFNPILVDRCSCCKTNIPAPLYLWKLFAATIEDPIPVCSQDCKDAIDAETKAQDERDRQLEAEYDQYLHEQESANAIEYELDDMPINDFAYDCYRDRGLNRYRRY